MAKNGSSVPTKKIMSPCDVEALKKCLEENKGDYVKCQAQIEAFKSCSMYTSNYSIITAADLQST
ncbi:putative dipeptidyl-aminopeptidase B [Bienertia sinuspersici]